MTTNDTSKKKRALSDNHPVKVFRRGAIAASIWKRQTSTGFEYLDFSLSRSWKLKSGEKEGYSQNFFERNEDDLMHVIGDACEHIRANQVILSTSNGSASAGLEEVDLA